MSSKKSKAPKAPKLKGQELEMINKQKEQIAKMEAEAEAYKVESLRQQGEFRGLSEEQKAQSLERFGKASEFWPTFLESLDYKEENGKLIPIENAEKAELEEQFESILTRAYDNPTLQKQKSILEQELSNRLGSQYYNTTSGVQARAAFETQRENARLGTLGQYSNLLSAQQGRQLERAGVLGNTYGGLYAQGVDAQNRQYQTLQSLANLSSGGLGNYTGALQNVTAGYSDLANVYRYYDTQKYQSKLAEWNRQQEEKSQIAQNIMGYSTGSYFMKGYGGGN